MQACFLGLGYANHHENILADQKGFQQSLKLQARGIDFEWIQKCRNNLMDSMKKVVLNKKYSQILQPNKYLYGLCWRELRKLKYQVSSRILINAINIIIQCLYSEISSLSGLLPFTNQIHQSLNKLCIDDADVIKQTCVVMLQNLKQHHQVFEQNIAKLETARSLLTSLYYYTIYYFLVNLLELNDGSVYKTISKQQFMKFSFTLIQNITAKRLSLISFETYHKFPLQYESDYVRDNFLKLYYKKGRNIHTPKCTSVYERYKQQTKLIWQKDLTQRIL